MGGGTISDSNIFPYEIRLRNFNNLLQELMHNTVDSRIGVDLNKNKNVQYNYYDTANKTLYDQAYNGELITFTEVLNVRKPIGNPSDINEGFCFIDDLFDAIGYLNKDQKSSRDKYKYIVKSVTWGANIWVPLTAELIPEYQC